MQPFLMSAIRAARRTLLAGACVGMVAGCGSSRSDTEIGEDPATCPPAGVLDGGGSLTVFGWLGDAAPSDAVWQARITGIGASCSIDEDENGIVDLRVGVEVVRGPAGIETEISVPYFVAIVDPDGRVLTREAFEVRFEVPLDRRGAHATEELTLRIPRPDKAPLSRYRIYTALQLTPEQLEYNRRTGRR